MSRKSELLFQGLIPTEMVSPNKIDRTVDTDWWGKVASDALQSGAGGFFQTAMHGLQDITGDPNFGKEIENWGADLQREHQQYYEPGSARYYASAAMQSLPEMGADMIASMGAAAAANAALGPQAAGAAAFLRGAAKGGEWAKRAYDFYNGGSRAAQVARYLTPTVEAKNVPGWLATTATSTGLESAFEGQRAMDDYIAEQKAEGNYIPGVTEQAARDLRYRVARDNAALLTGSNAVENALIFGKGKGFFGGLGRLARAMAVEGAEEGAQQIIPKAEQGKDWSLTDRDVIDSIIVGGLMGGGMHLGGRGIKAAFPETFGDAEMPTQGADIDEQVKNLKDGWNDVIPQIGGVLKNKFGLDGVISSGARTAEHNAEVGGAENSYHIQRADGGDALDIVLPDNTTAEQAEAIKQYFNDTGMFEEVLFHDVGSGYHLHLGGLKGGDIGNGQANADMSRFNDKQKEAWQEAQWVESQTGIPAEYIYRQWAHESGNFTSRLAMENNNFGGLTQSEPNGEENKQPDGGNYYRMYNNMHEYAQSYVNDFINRYEGKENIKSMEDFVNFLHDNGYFTADPKEYLASMQGVDAPTSRGGIVQGFNKDFSDGVIDFAGSNSDFIDQMYQRIVDNLNDEQKSALPGMFDEQGAFINTPENRQALAENEDTAELIRAEAERIAPEYTQSATSKQDVDRLFAPSGGSTMSIPQIEDAIKNDRLTDNEKAAVLQTATDHMNIPRPNLSDNEQAKFVNDLQSAIDKRDFWQIYSLLPNETAQAINALRTVPEVAQPIQNAPQAQQGTTMPQAQPAPVQSQPVTSQQPAMTTQEQERRLMELTGQQPANIILPEQRTQQEPQQEKPGFLKTAQDKVEENADRIRRNRIQQAVQSGDYATAEQLSGITLPRVNAPRSTVNFSERKRQLDAMPLGQLEQVGQQTLTAMQDAGVPVNADLARDLTAGNTSAIAHAEKKMAEATVAKNAQVETAANGGGGQSVQKEAKAVSDFRKKAADIIKQYQQGKIDYTEAFSKLESLYVKTDNAIEDAEAKQEAMLAFVNAGQELEQVRHEKEAQPAKPDYSSMTLDELKAERQKQIDEEVDRWKKSPGRQGVNTVYTYNDRGEINGRYGESLNPDWYQWAYKRNGNREPAKRDYPMLADEYLRNTQEYDELVQEIERREAAETKKAADDGGQESERKKKKTPLMSDAKSPNLNAQSDSVKSSVTSSVPQEQENVERENSDTNVLKGVEGLWESNIKDYIDRGFGIESYKGHKEGKKLVYDLTFESEKERQRFIDDFYGESEDTEEITSEDYKTEDVYQFEAVKAKDGKPMAAVKGEIPSEASAPVKSLAERHGGKYIRNAGGYVFDSAKERNQFMKEAEAFLGEHKYSAAWHGTGATGIDRLSLKYVGTGEGAQAHGYGLYFAQGRAVSEEYRRKLTLGQYETIAVTIDGEKYEPRNDDWFTKDGNKVSDKALLTLLKAIEYCNGDRKDTLDHLDPKSFFRGKHNPVTDEEKSAREILQGKGRVKIKRKPKGSLFKVEIPDEDVMLDEQKSYVDQPRAVQRAIDELANRDVPSLTYKKEGDRYVIYDKHGKEVDWERTEEKVKALIADMGGTEKAISLSALRIMNGRDIYNALTKAVGSPRKASEWLNEAGVKGITYNGGSDGRCYVVFDENAIEIIARYSARNREANMLSDITFTLDSKLTAREKELQAMGERMGVPIVFFEGPKEINGFHSNGISFINREAAMSPSWTFWHETFHWIKNNNPGLYDKLVEYVKGTAPFSKQQLDEYRESIGAPAMTDDEIIEEMMADAFPDVRKRLPFFKDLAEKDRNLYERLVAWIREAMDTLRDFFHKNVNGLSVAQVDQMHEKFTDMVRDIRGPNNEAIIKVGRDSNRTFTLPSGEPLLARFSARNRKYSLDNSDNRRYSVVKEIGEWHRNRILQAVNQLLDKAIVKRRQEGRTDEQIAKELQLTASDIMDEVLKPLSEAYGNAVAKHANKEDFVKTHTQGLDVGTDKQSIEEAYDIILRNAERMMDYARTAYKETAYANRRGGAGLRTRFATWDELTRAQEQQRRELREAGNPKNSIRPTSRSEKDGFSVARTMAELKAEAKEAFPNAKVEDKGDTIVMTMPNGQRVIISFHDSLTATKEQLAKAKTEHGFDQGIKVTVEGYAEAVNGEGFVSLSQGSRAGTAFHEAYHIAEAMAFTEKELRDAKRFISPNEEERANAYAKWRQERKQYSKFGLLWRKIADVAARMADFLGVASKRSLFLKVESGEIYERSPKSAASSERKLAFVDIDEAYNKALDKYQNAKSEEEQEAAYKALQELVARAAKEAGFADAIPEQTVAYKTRTKAAPKKTIKVYKVFTLADDGSPTALFVGGTEKLPQGVWLDAMDMYHFQAANGSYYVPSTKNPNSKGGATGTQVKIPNEQVLQDLKERGYVDSKAQVGTSITALAYRPGWHAGTLPFFPQGGTKIKNPDFVNATETPDVAQYADTPYPNVHRYNQVVFECELAFDKDYNEAARATKDGDLEYLPEDGSYYFATNPLTRANPELGAWVISGSLKIGRALTKEECDSILEKNGMAPQQWEGGEYRKGTEEERQAAIDNYMAEEYAKVDENGKHKKKQFENREVYQKWYDKQMKAYPSKVADWEKKVAAWEAGGKKGNKPSKPSRPKAINAMASGYGYISGDLNLGALGYTGPQEDAARKTLAPITYDDDGNVIPLSQRFNPEVDDVRYSIRAEDEVDSEEVPGSLARIRKAMNKLIGIKETAGNVEDRYSEKMKKKDTLDDTLPLTAPFHSMKYLARFNEAIKRMYYLGKKCMDEQEHLRNEFGEVIKTINKLVKDDQQREDLQALLWLGDAEKKEYSERELREAGHSEEVIKAYKLVRENLAKAYNLVNEARQQVKVRHKTLKESEIPAFMKENFVSSKDVISTQATDDGRVLLTFRGPKVYTDLKNTVSTEMLKSMEADPDIAITGRKELGQDVWAVTYNEKPKPMGKLKGYMPHFFHRFMVYETRKGQDGEEIKVSMGSADSLAGATEIANALAEKNPDKNFVIDTHGFEHGDENNCVVVGDKNFEKMSRNLKKNTEMNLKEANEFLKEKAGATLKSRHRFFGNMMKRTGAKGFDENMMWALTHYFNSAARYVAMEHFKPEAISWYERFFGDFNADPENIPSLNKRKTARLIKQYILDVNGTPRGVEKWCNAVVDRIPLIGPKLSDTYNGRPALALSSKLSWFNSVTKLGCLSVSSPILNFMQFVNVATMLDSVKYAKMGLNKALKPNELDQKILDRSGVMDEVNLSSDAGGYTQNRDYGGIKKGLGLGKAALDKSMFFFTWCDALMRKAAVLGAYYQGVEEKGMKPDKGQEISAKALEYAREVNSEANFDYSAANTPEMIRMGSVVTQQAFQFQKYPIMQFEFFWQHVVKGTNSQRAKFLAPYFVLTGLPGMVPFGELLAGALGLLIPGDDDDFAKKMKAELMRWAGNDSAKQAVVNSLTNGPLAAFTGIDISERAGMQNFFAGRYMGDKPESVPEAIANTLGGATLSTAAGVRKNLKGYHPIDAFMAGSPRFDEIVPVEAIKTISPGLGNIIQGALGETRTTHHRVGSTYDSAYEQILHAMGFRHIDETNTQFINSYLYESSQRQKEDKKYVMDAYLDNPTPQNREQLVLWGISDKALENYAKSREQSSKDRATGQEKKSKKPRTEAQQRDDELREWFK